MTIAAAFARKQNIGYPGRNTPILEFPMPASAQRIDRGEAACNEESCSEQELWRHRAPTPEELHVQVQFEIESVLRLTERAAGTMDFSGFESQLIRSLFRLGRLLIGLFLCLWQCRLREHGPMELPQFGQRSYGLKPRLLGTFFGKVLYWRGYCYSSAEDRGCYPLDARLGLMADGFSLGLLGRAVQLGTKMSFASAATVLASFLGWSPAASSIEEAVLGMGRYTRRWFEEAPPPQDDGEVLVIEIDSKATPTATEEELQRRRGKRRFNAYPQSPRHRGRQCREHWGPRKRRKKGDKAKNGKMATIVVMFTLRRARGHSGEALLLGPLNRCVYASYAPKRHAVAIARREADKRGFTPSSGKTVQLVTDGDEDLEHYIAELFPKAIHTLDIIHAIEYLWRAALCLFEEGTDELLEWVEQQKQRLYAGEAHDIVIEGDEAMQELDDPARCERLGQCLDYLAKRVDRMNYDWLIEQDLEIGSGAVEGAVRYVISQRFDEGGMRWVRERAEALLQLRCIEINGDWDRFLGFVQRQLDKEFKASGRHPRLLQDTPQPLPTYGTSSCN